MQKRCTHCKNHSYSSDDWYQWLCPYCGKDLTLQIAVPAGHRYVSVRPLVAHRLQPKRHDEDTA